VICKGCEGRVIVDIESTPARPAAIMTAARAASVLALPILILIGNPAVALLVGAAIVLGLDQRPFAAASTLSKHCLQAAIVLLGLRLDLGTIWSISADYTWLVTAHVVATLAVGLMIGRMLAVEAPSSKLVASGTAICGGTAIATLGSLVRARPHQMAVALSIVFLLNVLAVFAFPAVGHLFGLSQLQFGVWAGLAIHDTSSVLAAASAYGAEALDVATTIKLGRTLWLIPLILVFAVHESTRRRSEPSDPDSPSRIRLPIPLFILPFLAASTANTFLAFPEVLADLAGHLSKGLLVLALFFVGTDLTRDIMRRMRSRVLWLAIGLWTLVIPTTLLAVLWTT
jgi:uncharacterized integral membrane protein (TIGR00698 family)